MPKRSREYRRLPGRGVRTKGSFLFYPRCTLWLSHDHLLSVDNRVYSEDYKRFYLSDIQAIIIQKTHHREFTSFILALLTTVCGMFSTWLYRQEPGASWFFWGVTGFFLVVLTIEWLRGPTCKCLLITAVQEFELPSLSRRRTANTVIPILRQAIENVQGSVYPETG